MLYGGLLRTQSHTWLLFSDKLLVQSMLPRRCRRWIILWLVTGAVPCRLPPIADFRRLSSTYLFRTPFLHDRS